MRIAKTIITRKSYHEVNKGDTVLFTVKYDELIKTAGNAIAHRCNNDELHLCFVSSILYLLLAHYETKSIESHPEIFINPSCLVG